MMAARWKERQKMRGGVDQEAGARLLRHVHGEEEVKESSPKPKKRYNNNNNNKDKKMTEHVLRHDKKEGKEKKTTRPRSTENKKGPIRTGGWSNPAWKIVQPQPSPALVRAF